MIVKEHMQQGSEQWFAVRRGRPTASQFGRVLTPAKGQLAKGRWEYIDELIAETFCPDFVEFEGNRWTDRGEELEPQAREAFEALSGLEVQQVGFCARDDSKVGCSPDGLIVNGNGEYIEGLEIKCPSPRKHVGYLRKGQLPDDYKSQVHGGMVVTGLDVWHFVSFFPGLPLFWLRVERDEFTDKLADALDTFVDEYTEAREQLVPLLQTPVPESEESDR